MTLRSSEQLCFHVHNNWSAALISCGDEASAEAHFRAAVELRPRHPDALHNHGVALKVETKRVASGSSLATTRTNSHFLAPT